MRLIDADRLLQRTKFYNLKNGNRAIDEIDILHAPTVKAIPIAKVKQAREKIEQAHEDLDGYDPQAVWDYISHVDEILDKLIESEG